MADNDFAVDIPQTVGTRTDPQLAYQNNNPGNIEYNGQPGATLGDDGRFAKFPTAVDGYKYLRDVHIPKHANQTLSQYISGYAPPNENDTAKYITDASQSLGVSPETPVGQIDREKLARFQVQKESQSKVRPVNAFDRADNAPEPNAFDRADAAPLVTKPGEIPLPPPGGSRRPGATWDPKKDVLENLSNQAEDILPGVARNVGGMAQSAWEAIKDIGHHDTPADVAAKNAEWTKPLGEQVQELPVVGPLLQGRYGQAVGDAATGALLGRGLGSLPEGMQPPEGFTPKLSPKDVLNQQILQKVNEAATRRADIPEYTNPPLHKDVIAASKPLTEALAPTNAADFQDVTSRRLLPLLKDEEGLSGPGGFTDPKTVVQNMQRARDIAKIRNRMQFQPYVDSAEAHGLLLNGDQVATAQKAAIPAQFEYENPELAAKMKSDIDDAYKGKQLKPSQIQQFLETNNAKLKGYFDAKSDVQNAQALTQAQKSITLAQQDAYHDLLYKSIDPATEGANVRELQKRYGVLAEGGKYLDVLRDKQAMSPSSVGPLQKVRTGLDRYGKILDLEHPIQGLKNLIPEETPEKKLVRAMGSYPKESTLKEIPMADVKNLPITWYLEHPGDAEFARQQGLTEQPLPPSKMSTDFRQQYQDLPVHQAPMTPTEQSRLEWQRNLFPQHPERPVLPKINKKTNPSSHGNASANPPNVENESPWRY